MTEMVELVALAKHMDDNPDCPFCPGVKENDWTTFPGEKNDSGKLRDYMNKPSTNKFAQQTGARPKDNGVKDIKPADPKNQHRHQSPDEAQISPGKDGEPPIFQLDKYGDYGDEAHHCISGREIMDGHRIEKVITKGSLFKGDTGYTINNAANGVYLPSYPKKYEGVWGGKVFPKTFPVFDNTDPVVVNNIKEDYEFKFGVMKEAMKAGKGQAHIGSHGYFIVKKLEKYSVSYPSAIKKELNAILRKVINMGKECPFCVDQKGEQKKPFIPPYKVNQWLDNLSGAINGRLTDSPDTWPYFISRVARDFFVENNLPDILKQEEEFF